jgi:hypothetical protein
MTSVGQLVSSVRIRSLAEPFLLQGTMPLGGKISQGFFAVAHGSAVSKRQMWSPLPAS